MLDAAQQLLNEGQSFESLPVAEVCERAGLSVGAFYRRFESRDGFLSCLHERYVERVSELQAHLLSPSRWEGRRADADDQPRHRRGVRDDAAQRQSRACLGNARTGRPRLRPT
ncbi:MAG: TetR/AcrR family transcriptional regulator [Solirubrobacteraceae bacterium]